VFRSGTVSVGLCASLAHLLSPCPATRLFELRTRERELISEISGGQGQNKNLAGRIAGLDEQV
jgi:hypothetical protein